jgi:hypothetical protein
LIRL